MVGKHENGNDGEGAEMWGKLRRIGWGIGLAAIVGIAGGCASIGGRCTPGNDPQTVESRRLALDLMDDINHADTERILALYADDAVVWTPGSMPFSGLHQRSELRPLVEGILGMFPDGLHIEIHGVTAQGERVAIEAESHARTASGKQYNNHYHFLVIVRNGKIAELKEYMDTQHASDVLVEGAQ